MLLRACETRSTNSGSIERPVRFSASWITLPDRMPSSLVAVPFAVAEVPMSVQVLPVGRAYGVALQGPIVLLETADHEHYAFAEGQKTSALYGDGDKASELNEPARLARIDCGLRISAEYGTHLRG